MDLGFCRIAKADNFVDNGSNLLVDGYYRLRKSGGVIVLIFRFI